MQFVLNLAISIVSASGAYTGVFLTDKMPRRKVLWMGTLGCALMLAGNGGLSSEFGKTVGSDHPNLAVAKASVFFYFMFVS